MKGLRKKPKVNNPENPTDIFPPNFWEDAKNILVFSKEDWKNTLKLPPTFEGLPLDRPRCMVCNTYQNIAPDEWLRAERYLIRCLCRECFVKQHGVVSCTDWLPHVRLTYPELCAEHAHEFIAKDPMRNTRSAISRFVEALVRHELTGNGYTYRPEQAADLERITRRTAELLQEVLPKIAPYGRADIARAIGMIAVGVTGLGL
jgi:hypothetical protein